MEYSNVDFSGTRHRIIVGILMASLAAAGLGAEELRLQLGAGCGLGSASGGFFEGKGSVWADLGATSASEPGSWEMDPGIILGGLGGGVLVSGGEAFLFKAPFSTYFGGDLGLWGGGMAGATGTGASFAWAEVRALVLSGRAWLRATARAGDCGLYAELGPELGATLAFHVAESENGVGSTSLLLARFLDWGFFGIGGGLGFDFPIGGTRWGLEATAEYGFIRIASENGALGATITAPWRVQLCLTCSFGLAGKGSDK